jgi:hypothetical protein
MIGSSLKSTEKQKYAIEKFLATLLSSYSTLKFEFQLQQNMFDYYETQFFYVFWSEFKNYNEFSLAFIVFEIIDYLKPLLIVNYILLNISITIKASKKL